MAMDSLNHLKAANRPSFFNAKGSSATLKAEEESDFIIEESSWFSIPGKKKKPQKKTFFASFEGNQEAEQHNKIKTKRKVEETVIPIPLQEINTTLCNVGKRRFERFLMETSDNSDSISSFIPVAQELCHNTPVKKPPSPPKKQSGTQKKRFPAGPMEKKKRQLVSKQSLEDVHGEEHLDKKKNLHPSKLKNQLKRVTSQKVRETSLPKPQNNVLYQEDSCEQHVAKKHSNISVTPQNSERSLSHGQLLLPLGSDEMFRRKLNPFIADNYDSALPTNTPNIRRSKRTCIKPLEYWRGQRVDYKIDKSGGFVINGIISPEKKEPKKRKAKVGMKSASETENLPNKSIFTERFFQPAVVFDKASNQQILLECVHNGSLPAICFKNEILSIYKYFSTPSFASGKIILNPLKEKGYQYSHTETLVFHISCGKLLLMLYNQRYHLTAGNYFFIPPGNAYNIRNLLNEECVILFTQLKGEEHLDN